MIIVMPEDMTQFEKEINKFQNFEIESTFSKIEQLQSLGLIDAFTANVDFSKMTNDKIVISKAIHKVVVEIDENGSIASAVIMEKCIEFDEPKDVIINKPFYFAITNEETLPLFFGKTTHP